MMKVCIAALVLGALSAGNCVADPNSFDFDRLQCRSNLNQTPLGRSGNWSLEKLLALTPEEALDLWRSLPAVEVREMNGHYMGLRPDTGDAGAFPNKTIFKEGTSYFLGKGFKPVSDHAGEGYTRFRMTGGKIRYAGRVVTRVDRSLIDGKPAFILDYSPEGWDLVDELRKLDESIYLGVGTYAAGDGKRTPPDVFILTGPTDEAVELDEHMNRVRPDRSRAP